MDVQSTWIDEESATQPDEARLRAWDWRKSLSDQERTVPWLARHTGRAQTTVYRYGYGTLVPPLDWLRKAAAVLGQDVAA